MKNTFLILAVCLPAMAAGAAQSKNFVCSNKVDQLMALSREAGQAVEAYREASLKPTSTAEYLEDLEQQIYKQEVAITTLRTEFEACLKD